MAAFARSPSHRAVRRRIRTNRLSYGGASGRKSSHAIKIPRTSAARGQRLNATRPSRGVQRVSGSYYDGRRFREGTVGWEDDIVVEVRPGRARTPLAEGLIVPGLWNAHTHLGDAIVTRELKGTLEELVAPPHGLKHRVLAKAKDAAVIAAMRRAMATMIRTGATGFSDFREPRGSGPNHRRHGASHRGDDRGVLCLREDPVLEPARRGDELLDRPLQFLRHDRVAEVRMGVPQSRDDEALGERATRPSGTNLHDDILLPSDGPFPEALAVVEPARDALHDARWLGRV